MWNPLTPALGSATPSINPVEQAASMSDGAVTGQMGRLSSGQAGRLGSLNEGLLDGKRTGVDKIKARNTSDVTGDVL